MPEHLNLEVPCGVSLNMNLKIRFRFDMKKGHWAQEAAVGDERWLLGMRGSHRA